jgi:hypothetical protein
MNGNKNNFIFLMKKRASIFYLLYYRDELFLM